jgi:hypothetical protein
MNNHIPFRKPKVSVAAVGIRDGYNFHIEMICNGKTERCQTMSF